MMNETQTELLIETVRNYPVLYDTSHADYKNTRIKNKIWDGIAEMIGKSDGDTLKSKWKNLRDAYSKHLRSNTTHTGQAAKVVERYKTWPWAHQMSFLRPYLEFATTESNVHNDLAEDHSTSHQESEASLINTNALPPQHQHSRRRRGSNPNESQVDKVINFLNNKKETDFDDLDLIFLGYAKTLKKMTKSRQAKVKFQIAKIIMEAEIEQFEESNPRTDSRTLHSPEYGTLFTSPGGTNDSSHSYEYIVPSPIAANMTEIVNSPANIHTDSLAPQSSLTFCVNTESPQENLSRDIVSTTVSQATQQQQLSIVEPHHSASVLPTTDSVVTDTQQLQPSFVDPRQYKIRTTDNKIIKLHYEHFGKKN